MQKIISLLCVSFYCSLCYAEPITWSYVNDATVKRCQEETYQSLNVCKKLIELIEVSEKTGEIETGVVIEKTIKEFNLNDCVVGNKNPRCQKEINMSIDIPVVKMIKGYSKLISTRLERLNNGVIKESKNSVLIPDARYQGKGKYCYPQINSWKCDK